MPTWFRPSHGQSRSYAPGTDSHRRWPEIGFEEITIDLPQARFWTATCAYRIFPDNHRVGRGRDLRAQDLPRLCKAFGSTKADMRRLADAVQLGGINLPHMGGEQSRPDACVDDMLAALGLERLLTGLRSCAKEPFGIAFVQND